MEALHCSSPSLPSSFSFTNLQQNLLRRNQQLSYTKQRIHPTLIRTQALDNIVSISTKSEITGGDISVLLPISALLFSVYWITNFVVPGMVMKDLQPEASNAEATEELQADILEIDEATLKPHQRIKKSFNEEVEEPQTDTSEIGEATLKPRQRIKKSSIKKMFKPRK